MHEVPLYGGKAAGRVALVDDYDYELVARYRWNVCEVAGTATKRPEGPYAHTTVQRGGKKKTLRMHGLITGYRRTDHIDHNTLNNQRGNLRPATNSQNQGNRRVNLVGTSQFKGVCWKAAARGWVAQITVNKDHFYLGKFANQVDAARAYDVAAVQAFGEFALTNFPVPAVALAGGSVLRHRQPGEGWVPPERLARNLEIAARMEAGANGSDLAREYKTSPQNIYWIRKQYKDRIDVTPVEIIPAGAVLLDQKSTAA